VREEWYPVLESRRLGRRPVGLTRLGRRWVLWRDGEGRAVAMPAACPHRGADLARGRVVEGTLECPYHGFRFGADGACVRAPCEGAARPLRADLRAAGAPVREGAGLVWLWEGPAAEALPALPWQEALPAPGGRTWTATMQWDVPFPRVMEGFLDLHHTPFAHRKVAFGLGQLLDPYEARLEGRVIHTRGVLRHEDGRAWDGRSGVEGELRVRFPHLLLGRFGRVLGMAAATPVDAGRTWVVFRYQVPAGWGGWPLAWLLVQLELRLVQPDDHALLRDAAPRHPTREDLRLVRADAGVALWHRLYARALAEEGDRRPHPLPVPHSGASLSPMGRGSG
jgi:phenylpropionate dioxygenase-like ring-hydroxylating dioxygenase large terminal subunit